MLSIITILFFLTSLTGGDAPAPLHDFHVSKCLLEYNEEEQALQMSLHIFLDDLEEALRRRGHDKLFLCTAREAEQAEEHLQQYLRDRLTLRVNGQAAPYEYIGKEISQDLAAVWCYLEITGVSQLKTLEVSNAILMEVFDDQKNIVSITGPGRERGLLLFQKGEATKTATF